jgi:hypothetical protein
MMIGWRRIDLFRLKTRKFSVSCLECPRLHASSLRARFAFAMVPPQGFLPVRPSPALV